MRVLLQRVDKACLKSDEFESKIGFGLLAFVGVSSQDTIFDAKYLAKKIVTLRIFKDEFDKSNLSLLDVNGDIRANGTIFSHEGCHIDGTSSSTYGKLEIVDDVDILGENTINTANIEFTNNFLNNMYKTFITNFTS